MKTNKPKRIGLLTGGGDCPGLNAVIRAVTKSLIHCCHINVIGIEDGFLGLIEKRAVTLDWNAVSDILQRGGTILGTSNTANPFSHPVTMDGKIQYVDYSDQTVQNAADLGLDAIVCIGGDGTMTIAQKLVEKGLKIIGVPKTIDNDLVETDITFGYDTAMSVAAEAIDRIHTTASSHHRIMIVEIMGRNAGWLALGAGLAGGADIILIPEIDYDMDVISRKVFERSKRGKRFSIVAAAEGAKPVGGQLIYQPATQSATAQPRLGGIGMKLMSEIEECTGLEARATILGHLQRGGPPTAFDRVLATRYGVAAASLVEKGEFNKMVALQGNEIVAVPIAKVGGRIKRVPLNSSWIETARAVGTSFGAEDFC